MEQELKQLIDHITRYIFPDLMRANAEEEALNIKKNMHELLFSFSDSPQDVENAFMGRLPDLKRLIKSDVEAIHFNDPAVENVLEIVLCYPGLKEMLYYRTAHELYKLKVPVLPRYITEQAHSMTGIDIHPAATIGDHFCIDHGTGIVIGATSIIGSHVTIYQGVTLGAKNFQHGEDGLPLNLPRHPILEDNVTVYSNASILGRITIGEGSVIGGNVWLTNDVAPHSIVLQTSANITK